MTDCGVYTEDILRFTSSVGLAPDSLKSYIENLTDYLRTTFNLSACAVALTDVHFQKIAQSTGYFEDGLADEDLIYRQVIEAKTLCFFNERALQDSFKGSWLLKSADHAGYFVGVLLTSGSDNPVGMLYGFGKGDMPDQSAEWSGFTAIAKSIELYLQQQTARPDYLSSLEFPHLLTAAHEDLIFAKDEQFRIVFANPSFMQLYPGKNPQDILGTTTVEDYLPEDAEAFLEQDKIAFEQGKSEVFEEILMPDGRNCILWTIKKRYIADDGRAYILGIARDVTRHEQSKSELKQSNEDLENFAYIASHDLKAPLNSVEKICGWIKDDLQSKLDASAQEYFKLLSGRIDRMRGLLDDLLDYSRLGRMNYKVNDISVADVTRGIVEFLDIGQEFTVTADDVVVQLPSIPFELVLRNLIQNAVKHHHKGQGTVSVLVARKSRNYVICVDDDGPGIAPEYREKVVKIFQTLRPRDEVEGAGMGLAIVTKTLSVAGGDMKIEDSPIGGTRIQIQWPVYARREGLIDESK
ncbi:ATP-binding protein [Planctobacterium marinum]|uniref:ATP-binding protein n=1 Tax=Planctobacterium marinum TaxID=1631968 RepID=UPI001E372ECF|nr:ATP-binding protein [Planctobacterium marinum]MCC2607363.1 PAS domain-containing protein [Planctobacterium marinum]